MNDGDVQKAGERIAQGFQCHANAADLGLEQMPVGRLLLCMLGRGEARAFDKAHHRRGHQTELFAGLAPSLQVGTRAGTTLRCMKGKSSAHQARPITGT